MTKIKIFNSHSSEKEIFTPIQEGFIGMYVCGPTVYSHVHLGNLRTFMSFDLMYRYFKHLGYKVRYVRNITDVGHLEADSDDGDDKISKKARLEQLEPMEIVQQYTVDFHTVLQQFNNLPPSIEPTATAHIVEQIEIIKLLLNKELAYEVGGSVYFDVLKYNKTENYGELSKRNIEDLVPNTRTLDGQSEKRNPQDFALWKKANTQHIMRWPSPWGDGFPGWHLECTVMSTKYLGEQFDIHGGGMDLKFPHHECEIAQAKAAYGTNPVRYWLHANMLTLNGQKMSKSTGNTILPNELFTGNNTFFEKPIHPLAVRFFMLQAHYRSVLDLSNQAILASEKGFIRLMNALKLIEKITTNNTIKKSTFNVNNWLDNCYDALNDDFNTPVLISHLFEIVKLIHQLNEGKEQITQDDLQLLTIKLNQFVFDVLGLGFINEANSNNDKLNRIVEMLINIRNQARADKNWSLSDQIRDQLAALEITLNDGVGDTTYKL